MFNKTIVAVRDNRSTSYSTTNIDKTDKRLNISKTQPKSFFLHCKVGSEQFNILTSPDPYLIDKFYYKYEAPFESTARGGWIHKVYKCYDFGVTVLQIKINNEEAYFEVIKREEFENIKVDEGYKGCYSTGIPY